MPKQMTFSNDGLFRCTVVGDEKPKAYVFYDEIAAGRGKVICCMRFPRWEEADEGAKYPEVPSWMTSIEDFDSFCQALGKMAIERGWVPEGFVKLPDVAPSQMDYLKAVQKAGITSNRDLATIIGDQRDHVDVSTIPDGSITPSDTPFLNSPQWAATASPQYLNEGKFTSTIEPDPDPRGKTLQRAIRKSR